MNRFSRTIATGIAAAALGLGLTACGVATTQSAQTPTTTSTASSTAASLSTTVDTHFDSDDLTWSASDEVAIKLADGASTGGAGVTVNGHGHDHGGRGLPALGNPHRRAGHRGCTR